MPMILRTVGAAALLVSLMLPVSVAAQTPRFAVPSDSAVTRGVPPRIGVIGLPQGDSATVTAWRRVTRWAGTNRVDTLTVRSFATLTGTPSGKVWLGEARPIAGTWTQPDPLALFWSAVVADTAAPMPVDGVVLELLWHGRQVESLDLSLRDAGSDVATEWTQGDGFAGAFARPRGAGTYPALLVLHGSEGGDSTVATSEARNFANHGFATFAVTYFSWGGRIRGVPSALVNIPVEMLDRVRAWLGAQAGVDTSRTGIWGASKGAELALVTAARCTWPRAVVACAASDAVWSGFGRPAQPGEVMSSWSDGGRPLDFIPYDNFQDVTGGRITSRAEHDLSRARFADSVGAATIPMAQIHARLMLIGSDRDDVWPSGPMIRAMVERLTALGRSAQVEARIDSTAGHTVCGTGMAPAPVFEHKLPTDLVPDPRATARAAAENWIAATSFLRRALGAPDR